MRSQGFPDYQRRQARRRVEHCRQVIEGAKRGTFTARERATRLRVYGKALAYWERKLSELTP